MTHKFILDGQPMYYNAERKLAKTTIEEPFIKAGKMLGWSEEFGSPGIGLNFKICDFIIRRRATLIVRVSSAGKEYWISWDNIKFFIDFHNTEYKAGGRKWVHVFPWKLFKTKPMVVA